MKGAAALTALAAFAVVGGVGLTASSSLAAAKADDAPSSLVEDYSYPGADAILAEHQLKLFKGDGHILFDSKRTYTQGPCAAGLTQVEKNLADAPFGVYYCFRTIGSKGFLTLEVPNTFGVRGGTEDLMVTAKLPSGEVLEATPVKAGEPTPIEPGDGNDLPRAILVEIRMD